MCDFKYLNQRVRIIGEENGNSFKDVSKTKREKTHEEMSFYYNLPVAEKCLEKCLIF